MKGFTSFCVKLTKLSLKSVSDWRYISNDIAEDIVHSLDDPEGDDDLIFCLGCWFALFCIFLISASVVILSVVNCTGLYLLINGPAAKSSFIVWPWFIKPFAIFLFPFFCRLFVESGDKAC